MQNDLHDEVCGKREKATIATHDYNKLVLTENYVRYTATNPTRLHIHALNKKTKMTATELNIELNKEAEAYRREKKRSNYAGLHKYLHLLDKKEKFAYLEDSGGNVISLPPLTNSENSKVSLFCIFWLVLVYFGLFWVFITISHAFYANELMKLY